MSVQVEKLEKNMAKLTVEVSAEDFEKAVNTVYNRNKKSNRMSKRRQDCNQTGLGKLT